MAERGVAVNTLRDVIGDHRELGFEVEPVGRVQQRQGIARREEVV